MLYLSIMMIDTLIDQLVKLRRTYGHIEVDLDSLRLVDSLSLTEVDSDSLRLVDSLSLIEVDSDSLRLVDSLSLIEVDYR